MDLGINSLAGRVAIVTGASEGIGEVIATRLAQDGATVALAARETSRLEPVAAAIRAQGFKAEPFALELGNEAAVNDMIGAVHDRLGPVSVVVHCASATRFGTTATLTDQEWVDGFQVKVLGAIRLMKAAWPDLIATKGSVVCLGGVGARTPRDSHAMTGPLTAALMALVKVMADRGTAEGVQVNLVSPAGVRTPRFMNWVAGQAAASGIDVEEISGRNGPAHGLHPSRRMRRCGQYGALYHLARRLAAAGCAHRSGRRNDEGPVARLRGIAV